MKECAGERTALKILWVKAGGIYPPNIGGRIRSYQILRALARRHHVTLFTFYAATPDDQHSELEHHFSRVVLMPLAIPSGRTIREATRYARCLFSPLPYTVFKFYHPAVARRLLQVVTEDRPDVIVCDFVFAASCIPWDTPIPKVLFTHNIETAIWKHHYTFARSPVWKALSRREYRRMDRFERECVRKVDHVLAVSDHDRNILTGMTDASRIAVVPTGVDVEYFHPSVNEEAPNTLVFSGAMDWMPNEDGISYFIREILPRIRKQVPSVSLCVVGRDPTRELYGLAASQPGIEITGRVHDIRPFVHRGAVFIVPLRIGGGTRLKIFEAMAMGKAVVSTTLGAEGLPVRPGRDIVISDDPEEFARATIALLNDPMRRATIARAARELVERSYSWDAVVQPFETVLETVTVGKGGQCKGACHPVAASPGSETYLLHRS
jgi:polysaccharide biosynthesis protein PslH